MFTKNSVAVMICNGTRVLAVRRPDDDDELPGIWGLPAGTFREGESLEDLVERIGEGKLGAALRPVRKMKKGVQVRERYRLEMELWEARMDGLPQKGTWRWAELEDLRAGALKGSLCCRLALEVGDFR